MSITPTAGIAASWSATRQDGADQAVQLAMMKSQAKAEQTVAEIVDEVARAAPQPSPPAPPGQGLYVDKRA